MSSFLVNKLDKCDFLFIHLFLSKLKSLLAHKFLYYNNASSNKKSAEISSSASILDKFYLTLPPQNLHPPHHQFPVCFEMRYQHRHRLDLVLPVPDLHSSRHTVPEKPHSRHC